MTGCPGSYPTAGVGRKIEHLPGGFVLRCSASGLGHPFLIGVVGSPTGDAEFVLLPFFHRDKACDCQPGVFKRLIGVFEWPGILNWF
jgi:hypothetical protein